MGALANTRGLVRFMYAVLSFYHSPFLRLGDKKFKPFGVTPEPEVRTKLLKGIRPPLDLAINCKICNHRSRMGVRRFRLRWDNFHSF
jgi:hypothetical protein